MAARRPRPPSSSDASDSGRSAPRYARPRPGAGWTTRPAGLSTISRSASSYTIRSGMSGAGARSRGVGGGTSSRSSVPAVTTVFARSASPSAVSRPSEMSFCTKLRDRPVASATYRSTRPAGPSGTRSTRTPGATPASTIRASLADPRQRRDQRGADQHHDRDADGGVRHVERVPAEATDPDVDEVHDIAETKPIGHIAEPATEQQAERDREVDAAAHLPVVHDDQADHEQRHDPEQQRVVAEEAEQRSGVLAVYESDVVAEDGHELTRRQARGQPCLGQLIEHQDGQGQPEEDEPVRRPTGLAPYGRRCGRVV